MVDVILFPSSFFLPISQTIPQQISRTCTYLRKIAGVRIPSRRQTPESMAEAVFSWCRNAKSRPDFTNLDVWIKGPVDPSL
jgi:hypothetical protein